MDFTLRGSNLPIFARIPFENSIRVSVDAVNFF